MGDDLPRREPLSKTPSWVMVGFVLGGLSAYTLERHFEKPDTPPAPRAQTTPTQPAVTVSPPKPAPPVAALGRIEDMFDAHRHHAVWIDDTTEVAIYNPEKGGFTDLIEVRREGDLYYFRSIPRLTRPLVDRGMGPEALILFTGHGLPRAEVKMSVLPAVSAPTSAVSGLPLPAAPTPPRANPSPFFGPPPPLPELPKPDASDAAK